MLVKIKEQKKQYYLHDVAECYYDGIELSIVFYQNHRYNSIEEIEENLPYEIGNFYFKGLDTFDYDIRRGLIESDEVPEFRENGGTNILCVLHNARVIVLPEGENR